MSSFMSIDHYFIVAYLFFVLNIKEMTIEDLRDYEKVMHEETNRKLGNIVSVINTPTSSPTTPANTPTDAKPPVGIAGGDATVPA